MRELCGDKRETMINCEEGNKEGGEEVVKKERRGRWRRGRREEIGRERYENTEKERRGWRKSSLKEVEKVKKEKSE